MSDIQDFADQKFKRECSQIVLTQARADTLVFAGPGEIWQNDEGILQFKIFISREACQKLNAYMVRPGVIGQLIPDKDYFRLEAQDYALPIWTSQNVLPTPRGGLTGGFAHGYLRDLVQTKTHPPNQKFAFVTLRFRGKLEFPSNEGTMTIIRVRGQDRAVSTSFDVAFIDDRDHKFEIRHERAHTLVSLELPRNEFTLVTPSRIHEALQFVLGRELTLMAIETTVNGEHMIQLTSPSRGQGKLSPPLEFQSLDVGGHIWRMFTNYFRYVHSNAEIGWHPVSRHLGSVIQSTAASFEARLLALAVAVEGLADVCFNTLAPANPQLVAEVEVVTAALQGISIGEQTRNRITGALNAMRQPRGSDILRAFIANYRLPNALYTSWSRIRHVAAHGGGAGTRDDETVIRLQNEVLSLLYSLVFAAIGYNGLRTDYSIPGFPSLAWPTQQV